MPAIEQVVSEFGNDFSQGNDDPLEMSQIIDLIFAL
jgi:hypothetical protein